MELLSPAGHWEAMVAAVQNGADAVYLGCGDFNARRGAKNFTDDELPAAVAYCHLRGVKVYLTLNTLLTDRELPQAEAALRRASRCGVDAAIVQDWGLAALAREIVPDLPLHGSTQMTVHSLAGVEHAAKLGLRCVVLGRELSAADIRAICAKSPISIEVFAHGALCMCWSGQCAMSALIGERSGNRGLCAQPCRLPYRLDSGKPGRPLSLKDACLASHLTELEDMGVSILKLEGRMKRPEYVAVITRVYAALLRERRAPTRDELDQLTLAFSRQGFTDGYWQGRLGPHMFGSRPENAPDPTELFQAAKAAYQREDLRTVPVALSARIRTGRPAVLTAYDPDGNTSQTEGPVPEPARTRPLTAGDLTARLSKTGGTAFRAEQVDVTLDEGLSLSAGAVNALRREALERLTVLRTTPPQRREAPAPPIPESAAPSPALSFTVSLSRGDQLTGGLLSLSPAVVYLPAERIGDFDLSPWTGGPTEFCVSLENIGQIALARDLGFPLRGGLGLNIFNSRSLLELQCWGFASAAVSFELRHEQIRDLRKPIPCEAVVYGRLPMMTMENCVVSNALGCRSKDGHGPCGAGHVLTDRRGERFPIQSVFGCRNEIENSRVMFLADKPEFRRCGLCYARLRFTDESPESCINIFARYLGRGEDIPSGYTRGLFYRGVE